MEDNVLIKYYFKPDFKFNGIYFEVDAREIMPFQRIVSVSLNDSLIETYEVDNINKTINILANNESIQLLINDIDKHCYATVNYVEHILK